jgi:peptide/nickel transport system permease protein
MALSTGKFVRGRVASVVIVIVGVTGLTWLSVNALRPDLRAGDDRFIFVALFDYLQSAFLHFDFGTASDREVQDVIREGLPADLSLLIGGMAVGLLGGLAGGAYCAARRGSPKARALETAAVLFMCAPVYVVGLMLLLFFGAGLAIVQSGIYIPTSYTTFGDSPLRWAGSLLVPWLVLGLPLAGVCLRMMRASMAEVMAEVMAEDYLRTAMAKGLRPRTVVRRHAVPSAVAPVFTLTGVTISTCSSA